MATSTEPNQAVPQTDELSSTARAYFAGLVWGAVMLIVLGFWIRTKYQGQALVLTNIFLLAGLVAAGLAVCRHSRSGSNTNHPAKKPSPSPSSCMFSVIPSWQAALA